jgi:hypothetical protein
MVIHMLFPHKTIYKATVIGTALLCSSLPPPGLASTDWIESDQPVPKQSATQQLDKTYKGESKSDGGMLLKGTVNYCVPKGTPIKLKIATVPSHGILGMRLAQRNLDGQLHPAQLNEEISAKTTEDIFVDDNKVIPQGTVFHGKVTKIFPPKRVGRPGSLVLSFDTFTTPDGRKFAFRVEANNTRQSTVKSKAKGLGMVLAHTGGGAAVGAIIAYSLFGLEQTIAMHGYNVAGGAAAGALLGTAVGLMRKGPHAVLEPGDDLNMEIDTDLLVPAATAPTAKLPNTNFPGLQMKINKTKVKKDGLEGYDLLLDFVVYNDTNNRLNSIDLYVEDDNNNRYQVVAGDDDDYTDMMFSVEPYSEQRIKCNFSIEYPKVKHRLVWLDHKSRNILYRMKIQ